MVSAPGGSHHAAQGFPFNRIWFDRTRVHPRHALCFPSCDSDVGRVAWPRVGRDSTASTLHRGCSGLPCIGEHACTTAASSRHWTACGTAGDRSRDKRNPDSRVAGAQPTNDPSTNAAVRAKVDRSGTDCDCDRCAAVCPSNVSSQRWRHNRVARHAYVRLARLRCRGAPIRRRERCRRSRPRSGWRVDRSEGYRLCRALTAGQWPDGVAASVERARRRDRCRVGARRQRGAAIWESV